MPLATTLRLLAKARGLSATDLATAIPKAGAATVTAWLPGEKLPGREQLDALARTLGVPAGALLAELASTFDPARTKGEHDLLSAYRAMDRIDFPTGFCRRDIGWREVAREEGS